MSEEEVKYAHFLELWNAFEKIKPILLKAGIPEERMLKKETIEKKLYEWHLNKVIGTMSFVREFTETYIDAWIKIRSEHSEDYWDRTKLLKWGDEFVEIRELNKVSREIREKWFDRKNMLVRRKEKKADA